AKISDITMVVRFRKNLVMKEIGQAVKYAVQKKAKGGTADAAKAGLPMVSNRSKVLVIINGDDSAFYKSETIEKIIEIHKERKRKLTFVSLIKENPVGLGRIIRGSDGLITKIVEEKDANDEERKIKEVNDGFYVFDKSWFEKNIVKIQKGPQGEFYLVYIIKLAIDQGDRMATYTLSNDDEWQGVNTPEQLEEANRKMAARLITNF
ncbi:MAG: sugar phosphate nucleotidyltransferase, partial [Candidatus Woesebacteria bacterium]|nr:sugar phosphate nucleotidyltransferase [Candidatus Woesebacteria bacterium]